MRRPDEDQPRLVGELAVIAKEPFAGEQPVVFEALLRARRAEARRRGIELHLQRNGGIQGKQTEIYGGLKSTAMVHPFSLWHDAAAAETGNLGEELWAF